MEGLEEGSGVGRALLALAGVTLVGTLGFVQIEGWSFDRALFFTLITITTVGYGDEGISDTGRRFALLLLLCGIGVATWAFKQLVETAVSSPLDWRRRMQQRIESLEQHVIVCGFGRMGRTVAEELAAAGTPLVVLDESAEAIADAVDAGHLAIQGNACEDEGLLAAGIERAAHLVSAVDAEAENIVVALTARGLRPAIPITARAQRDEEVRKLRRAGATRIVSPYRSGGREIARGILGAPGGDVSFGSELGDDPLAFTELVLAESSAWVGRTPAALAASDAKEIAFVACAPGAEAEAPLRVPPPPDEPLTAGARLVLAGSPQALAHAREHATR